MTQQKSKGVFLLIIDKISKSKKTRKESEIVNFICDTPRTPYKRLLNVIKLFVYRLHCALGWVMTK